MFLSRIYDRDLAQAAYLIGCQKAGEAVVVDPNRDTERYIAAAAAENLRISHVTETHIHADFVSGARELARRTGARLCLSDEGGPDWQYRFAADSDARLLRDGDEINVGRVRLEVMHTPGHTPEHISFMVTDTASSNQPVGILTGDFVFVGDVGRPDLLERAARVGGTMDGMARQLFRSLQQLREMPDYLQVWPGHGAGSACGKALGALPSSTLGYERIGNWALQMDDENEFVKQILHGQPDPPAYFARMKTVNRDGPLAWPRTGTFDRIAGPETLDLVRTGATVVDIRDVRRYVQGHVAGTINVPLGTAFTKWAGSLLSESDRLILVDDSDSPDRVLRARRNLGLIGIDGATGWSGSDFFKAAERTPLAERLAEITPTQLAAMGDATILDVRDRHEWDDGHIPGAVHLSLVDLARDLERIPKDEPVVIHCKSGSRSVVAATILRANGFPRVSHLAGGFDAWSRSGRPVTRA